MQTSTNKMITPDRAAEIIPYFDELPPGYIQVGRPDEMICDYDHYMTGDPDRANGCGGIYYQRMYITPERWAITERTPCQCMLAIMQEREQSNRMAEIQSWKDNTTRKAQLYFQGYDMMQDQIYNRMTFDRYKAETEKQKEALNQLTTFEVGRKSICLYGDAGRGKTHLALATARVAREQNYTVLAVKAIDMLTRIKRTFDKKDDAAEIDIMRVLKNIDLLVIDDIGQEKTTEWVTSKFYEIIDSRHGRRSTIYTTNLSGQEMKNKEGKALVSRIWGAEIRLQVDGKDFRVEGER